MRDCLNNRGGFDRVLMAVAATFLTVSATSAMAQSGQNRTSAAELAIEAAVLVPEPANVPPPTINDFKMDSATTASITSPASAPAAPVSAPTAAATAPQVPAPLTALPTTATTAPAVPLKFAGGRVWLAPPPDHP